MKSVKSINLFLFLVLVATLCTMGAWHFDITPLRIASYFFECILIFYCLYSSHKTRNKILSSSSVIIVSVILVFNYLLSNNEPTYSDLLKYFGYLCCFMYGNHLARIYKQLDVSKVLLYSLVFIPVFTVAFFDNTLLKNSFFITPNGFVYFGVSMGLLYLLVNGRSKKVFIKAVIIVLFYILICTSLGVVVAAFAVFLLLNLKKSNMVYIFVGGLVFFLAIQYIDIPLFIRFRDTIAVWKVMSPEDWKNIQDVSTYELAKRADSTGERTDSASSIWRLIHWIDIIIPYITKVWTIPFGMGAGYSVKLTGLAPHNDYLLILTEYGLIVFSFFIALIKKIYKRMKNEGMLFYFIMTMFFYHLTENLVLIFPPNTILYFAVGWCAYKYQENKTNSKKVVK